jgi:hypothetical protein
MNLYGFPHPERCNETMTEASMLKTLRHRKHQFFEVADSESETVNALLKLFSQTLLNDNDNPLNEFHFGCNADRIEWDDHDFEHQEIAPPAIEFIKVTEFSTSRLNAITCEGIHGLIFDGPHGEAVRRSLTMALIWERQRVAMDASSGLFLDRVRQNLKDAREGMLANARASSGLPLCYYED